MFLRFLKSIKLSIILIVCIIIICIVATLIPQGNEAKFYIAKYGTARGHFILKYHLHRIFRSAYFLIPVCLFFINLLMCTVSRLRRQAKAKKYSIGPDLIHIGILLLIIAGMTTLFYRSEGFADIREGGEMQIGKNLILTLTSFDFIKHPDGSPRNWISHVEIKRGKKVIKTGKIEVNHPMRIGQLMIYQQTQQQVARIIMKGPDEKIYNLAAGRGFLDGDNFYMFTGIKKEVIDLKEKKKSSSIVKKKPEKSKSDESLPVIIKPERKENRTILRAVFREYKKGERIAEYAPKAGEKIGNRQVEEIFSHYRSGLKIVRDVGFFPMLASIILIIAGLLVTYIAKLREMETE